MINTEGSSTSIDVLLGIVQQLFSEPHPVGIWFVDATSEYLDLIQHFGPQLTPYPIEGATLYGMRIMRWTRHIATEEEWERVPAFCDTPGVWLEMSDGKHHRLGSPLCYA